jgi:hypothetical protein
MLVLLAIFGFFVFFVYIFFIVDKWRENKGKSVPSLSNIDITKSVFHFCLSIASAEMLFFALEDSPYVYYQVLRWFVFISSAYEIYIFKLRMPWFTVMFVAIAILFNPIVPITMSKDSWKPLDVISGIIFLIALGYQWKRISRT